MTTDRQEILRNLVRCQWLPLSHSSAKIQFPVPTVISRLMRFVVIMSKEITLSKKRHIHTPIYVLNKVRNELHSKILLTDRLF